MPHHWYLIRSPCAAARRVDLRDGVCYITCQDNQHNRLMLDLVQFWSRTKSMPTINDWEGYVCPITKDRMQQPALASDGITYELVAIEAWVLQHHTSPLTREPITSVTPNRVIQALVTRLRPRLPSTQSTLIPWQVQVDMWCNLFENLIGAIELAVIEHDAMAQ